MSNKGFITPFDTGLSEDSTYSNWVKVRHHGNEERCSELETKARGLLQKLIDDSRRLGLEHKVNQRRHPQSDGSLIMVHYYYENPVIDIFAPSGKGKKPRASLFQCDLYQDHADTPEDLNTQTITPIYFNVVDIPYWKEIPERQGNMEWKGEGGLISWDSVQNWGRGILNKQAWNDAVLAERWEASEEDNELGTGTPYDPRPVHASRRGEISSVITNYPQVLDDNDVSQAFLWALNYYAYFDNNLTKPWVYKDQLFLNGNKIVLSTASNQMVMGACLGTDKYSGITYCTVVLQTFRVSVNEGILFGTEEFWYFDIADPNKAMTKIDTVDYTNPPNAVYSTAKAHLTPWKFKRDGSEGKALRSEQYHYVYSVFNEPYVSPRFCDLNITYSGSGVTADTTLDTCVTAAASEIGGSPLTPEERDAFSDLYIQWNDDLEAQMGYPLVDELNNPFEYKILDIDYHDGKLYSFGVNKTGSVSGLTTTVGFNIINGREVYVDKQGEIVNEPRYSQIYAAEYTGTKTVNGSDSSEHISNHQGLFYVGGSPYNNIAFFVRVSVEDAHLYVKQNGNGKYVRTDSPYEVTVQLICLFRGTEKKIGSPIIFKVPQHIDMDSNNSLNGTLPLNNPTDTAGASFASPFLWSHVNGTLVNFLTGITPTCEVMPGDFGGSIKCAPDGSHVVMSCSYMDIAKFIYPWHRDSLDQNISTTVNRTDTMDKLGVDPELQEAWNKYMINYAIIGPNPEGDDGESANTDLLVGISLGGTGGASPTITGIGGSSSSADFRGTGLDVQVEQMSRLLFNKKVTEDLPSGSSDNHSDYEFGIKEKDTNAFLPIGIYAFPE